MTKQNGIFKVRVKLDDECIVDTKLNNIIQVSNLFEDIKKKFK